MPAPIKIKLALPPCPPPPKKGGILWSFSDLCASIDKEEASSPYQKVGWIHPQDISDMSWHRLECLLDRTPPASMPLRFGQQIPHIFWKRRCCGSGIGFRKRVFRKRGLFRKVHFLEIQERGWRTKENPTMS